ncbi:hypothetical protein, partial [Klebsiella aerogenes]|uniref:hypothetical protein n=1 Tax=Klebsiella aerogenes TaxID=548 RepID=UPI0019534DE2
GRRSSIALAMGSGKEMMRLTLRVVAKTLFDAEVKNESDEIGAALTTVIELYSAVMTLPFLE